MLELVLWIRCLLRAIQQSHLPFIFDKNFINLDDHRVVFVEIIGNNLNCGAIIMTWGLHF